MAATVQIRQLTGTSPGESGAADVTSQTLRFGRTDTVVTASQTPIPVPTSGQSYSMRVVLKGYIASGTFTSITNPVWYSDGSNSFGTGRKLWYQMSAGNNYTAPSIPIESNDPPQLSGAMTDWFATNSGAPADGDALSGNPTHTSASLPKYFGDHLNLVFEVEAASVQGIAGPESVTLAWSEV